MAVGKRWEVAGKRKEETNENGREEEKMSMIICKSVIMKHVMYN